jgi:hypothetical protein
VSTEEPSSATTREAPKAEADAPSKKKRKKAPFASAAASEGPRCPCGYHEDHTMVSAVRRYDVFGWFLLTMGISAKPKRIDYQCRRCDTILRSETDPEVLHRSRTVT